VLLGGDDHHRHRGRLVAQVDQAAQAVHAGHVEVEQDEVEVVVFLGQRQGTVEVGGFHHHAVGEAVADHVVDGLAKQRVIVGDQYLVHSHYLVFVLVIMGSCTGLAPSCGQGSGTGSASCSGRPACSQASIPSRYQYSRV